MLNKLITGAQNNGDSVAFTARGGRYGDAIASALHGDYFETAYRGQSFYASTVIAGVVVPVAAATLNSKFTLWNPAASGRNVELISVFMMTDNATTVVGAHGLLVQRNLAASGGIPTTVTTLCPSLPAGLGGESKITVAAQATLTNAQIPGVATAPYIGVWPIGGYGATTAAGGADLTHDFKGKLILAPDSLVALVATVAASGAAFCQICWAEYPV